MSFEAGACYKKFPVDMPPSELAGLLWLLEATMRHSPSLYAAFLDTCPGSVLLIDFLCENWLNTTEKH